MGNRFGYELPFTVKLCRVVTKVKYPKAISDDVQVMPHDKHGILRPTCEAGQYEIFALRWIIDVRHEPILMRIY